MSYRYIETSPRPDEANLARLTCEVVSARLHMREPEIVFIRESVAGGIVQESRILGLADSLKIWLLSGMEPRELVRTTAHEVKHVKDFFSRLNREREAFLFESEFAWNLRGRTYDELIAELIVMREDQKNHQKKE